MALVRCVTEMGMGVDVHGLDYTAAAKRAVFDAIHHSSLGFPRLVGKTADDMRVDVTIGVPKPEAVDRKAVLETLPHGGGHINVVQGGLQVLNEKGDDGWLIANAIIVVSIDDGKITTIVSISRKTAATCATSSRNFFPAAEPSPRFSRGQPHPWSCPIL